MDEGEDGKSGTRPGSVVAEDVAARQAAIVRQHLFVDHLADGGTDLATHGSTEKGAHERAAHGADGGPNGTCQASKRSTHLGTSLGPAKGSGSADSSTRCRPDDGTGVAANVAGDDSRTSAVGTRSNTPQCARVHHRQAVTCAARLHSSPRSAKLNVVVRVTTK